MYVVCFYWEGDRWQTPDYVQDKGHENLQQVNLKRLGQITDDLPARYINNLYCGVKRFAKGKFKFVCFTNKNLQGLDGGIEVRDLPMVTKHGVLPRLYMFSKEAGLFGHQVLCLDIDVVIVGSLKDIMEYDGLFCARSKFQPGAEHKLDGDIMSFQAGEETERIFWKPFIEDIDAAVQLTQGRERYWYRHVADAIADRWDRILPGQIVSWKRHVRLGVLTPQIRIVSCHGSPRPHEIIGKTRQVRKFKWIESYWK